VQIAADLGTGSHAPSLVSAVLLSDRRAWIPEASSDGVNPRARVAYIEERNGAAS
jgi:hypothetical protein